MLAHAKTINDAATDKARGLAAAVDARAGGSMLCRAPATQTLLPPQTTPTPTSPQVEVDEGVLRRLALTARACLNPMAAMFGGVVGQEVGGGGEGQGGGGRGRQSAAGWLLRVPPLPRP